MRVWPGITPWNVWQVTYSQWRAFADSVDTMRAAQTQPKPRGGKRS